MSGKKGPTKTKGTAKAKVKAKAKAKTKDKKKKTKRGRRFFPNEIALLLKLAKKYKPLTADQWNTVERVFETYYPEMNRDEKALKRKFDALCHTKQPAGNPHCPPNVKLAKEIRES